MGKLRLHIFKLFHQHRQETQVLGRGPSFPESAQLGALCGRHVGFTGGDQDGAQGAMGESSQGRRLPDTASHWPPAPSGHTSAQSKGWPRPGRNPVFSPLVGTSLCPLPHQTLCLWFSCFHCNQIMVAMLLKHLSATMSSGLFSCASASVNIELTHAPLHPQEPPWSWLTFRVMVTPFALFLLPFMPTTCGYSATGSLEVTRRTELCQASKKPSTSTCWYKAPKYCTEFYQLNLDTVLIP